MAGAATLVAVTILAVMIIPVMSVFVGMACIDGCSTAMLIGAVYVHSFGTRQNALARIRRHEKYDYNNMENCRPHGANVHIGRD